jgi:hypothetical protein
LDRQYQRTIPSFDIASRPLPSPRFPARHSNLNLCRLQIQRTIDQTHSRWISLPALATLIRPCREPLAVLTSIDRKSRIISIGSSGQSYAPSAECAFGRREEIYQPTIIIVAPLPRISSRRHLCLLHASRSIFFESRNAHHPSIPFIPSTTLTSTLITRTSHNRSRHLSNAIRSRSVVPASKEEDRDLPYRVSPGDERHSFFTFRASDAIIHTKRQRFIDVRLFILLDRTSR